MQVAFFVELEGVGEADALEGFVFPADESVIDGLDVDGGDVVGEQDDLVGVELVLVLCGAVRLADEAALEQADDEGAGAGEGIDDVDILAAEGLAEFAAAGGHSTLWMMKSTTSTGRIDDAEALGHLGEGIAEELVVKLDDDLSVCPRRCRCRRRALRRWRRISPGCRLPFRGAVPGGHRASAAWPGRRDCGWRRCSSRTGRRRRAW